MNFSGMILLAESMTLTEQLNELKSEMETLSDSGTATSIALMIFFYVVVWFILVKLHLTSFEKNIKKAKANNRIITATFCDKHVSRGQYHGYGKGEEGHRFFGYSYTHPLTGKEKRYSYEIKVSGMTPPQEVELYYDEKGRVFTIKEESRRAGFWIACGIIVPLVLASIVQFGF